MESKDVEVKEKVQFEVKNVFGKHNSYVLNVLFFGSPHNKVVTSDRLIWVWNFGKSYELVKKFGMFEKPNSSGSYLDIVHKIIKWNNEEFLCCEGPYITSYSIKEPFERMNMHKSSSLNSEYFYKVLKMNSDSFIGITSIDKVILFEYPSLKMKKIIGIHDTDDFWTCLVKSKKYPNSFWINSQSAISKNIRMINIETSKIEKEFKYSGDEEIYRIESFLNYNNDEIVITGLSSNVLVFYNSKTNTKSRDIDIGEITIRTFTIIDSSYLIIGSHQKVLFITLPQNDEQNEKIVTTTSKFESISDKLQNGDIYNVSLVSRKRNSAKFLSCSYSGQIAYFKAKNLKLSVSVDEKQIMEDLQERINFILERLEHNELFEHKIKQKLFVIKISLTGNLFSFNNVLKILLL